MIKGIKNKSKFFLICLSCLISIIFIIVSPFIIFYNISVDPMGYKKAEKFEDLNYGIDFFEQKKDELMEVVSLMQKSDISNLSDSGHQYKAKKGYEFDSDNYKSNKKYANDISSILSANKWEGVKKNRSG